MGTGSPPSRGTELSRPIVDAALAAYSPRFRQQMTASAAQLKDPGALIEVVAALPAPARDLLDELLTACGAVAVESRFRPRIERDGEPLWLAGLLLPRSIPPGARVDPRHFAGQCRLNPALADRQPFAQHLLPVEASATFPPSDAKWDAVVISAALENNPPALTQSGQLRRDTLPRLMRELGEEPERWSLALRLARASGLARSSGGRLRGYPESRPRRVTDKASVLSEGLQHAGRALLRLVGEDWIELDALLDLLLRRGREVLFSPLGPVYLDHAGARFDDEGWTRLEAPAFREAAAQLHRLRALDAELDAQGVRYIRAPQPTPLPPPGFLLTPDLDILVAAGELRSADYGRLARAAPFVEGTRVHRHRLTQEGVAADLAAGHKDLVEFLERFSRTGVAPSVRQSLAGWSRTAQRVTLVSGVTLLEDDEGLRMVRGPQGGREVDYLAADPPPATFYAQEDRLLVPFGQDALTVRGALASVAELEGQSQEGWIYRLAPRPLPRVDQALERLRQHAPGMLLPGALEVSVRAAQSELRLTTAPALVVHVGALQAPLLRDDAVRTLCRPLGTDALCVEHTDLAALQARLAELGVEVQAPG